MEKKKYSSYAEIENDLEILKLERQISYQKLVLNVQRTKDSITPENIVSGFLEPYKIKIPNSLRFIFKTITPYVMSYFLNRKRGN
ncbi:DUF6327 family protein [Flavobacterium gilvum]|uniref:Uncharacterized protein n=1 Tax=Flavobacterium gilvum TaxID=1492737 RepID=A0AAC9I255_9FLAO|nr:DUF6327 family protein [Flavobacterium gilvum]AOW08776.1 hypothetical protein EM308_04245 [Flavobacterium gilvum]KFC58194.1 hypothetical protein FEM08_30250 [Flavobacterium gilvum]